MTMPNFPLPPFTGGNTPAGAPTVAPSAVPVGRRSCKGCPSLMTPSQQGPIIMNAIAAPMCGLKMLPLLSPTQDRNTQDRAMKKRASTCPDFGKEVELNPIPSGAAPIMQVGFDPTAYTTPDPVQSNANCDSCANFVEPQETQSKTGWTGGICRAKGNLQISGWARQGTYAKQCGSYVRYDPGTHRRNLDGFQLLPIYRSDYGKLTAAGGYRQAIANIVDPIDWPNEREEPLTSQEVGRNIRAFRRISDPDGYGEDVFLPIYNNNWIPSQQALVPRTGDKERPELYADHGGHIYTIAVNWLHLDETPAAWGPGGVGKTEIYRHLAWLMQLPFHRISITAETTVDELAGKYVFQNNETKFINGLLPTAWGHPSVIVFDEPNTGQNEVWQIVRPLTDASKTLILAQNENERIERGPDTFFGMAMNPNWDVLNVGTNVVGDADMSRLIHMFFDYPPEELEREILRGRVPDIDETKLTSIMRATKDLRALASTGQIDSTWGIRHNIKVAKAIKYFTPAKVYKLAIADGLPPAQMEAVDAIVNSNFKVS